MVISFLVGWLGFGFIMFVLLVIYYTMWHLNYNRKEMNRQIYKEKALWRENTKRYDDAETLEWVNRMMKQFWHRHKAFLSNFIMKAVNVELEKVRQTKVKFLKEIKMSGFDFGSFAPIIDTVRVGTLNEETLKYDCDVKFASDMTIETTIDFGAKLVLKTVNPINFAKMRLEFEYIDTMPFVGTVAFTFLERPEFDWEFKIMNSIDLMTIPGIDPWVYDVIHLLVIDQMFLFPNKFVYDVAGAMARIAEAKQIENQTAQTATPTSTP